MRTVSFNVNGGRHYAFYRYLIIFYRKLGKKRKGFMQIDLIGFLFLTHPLMFLSLFF